MLCMPCAPRNLVNRRRDPRYRVQQSCRLSCQQSTALAAIHDIGWGGLRLEVDGGALRPRQIVLLSCHINGVLMGSQRVPARVVWVKNNGMSQEVGLAFLDDIEGTWARELIRQASTPPLRHNPRLKFVA